MTLYDFCYLTWPPLFKLFLRLEIFGRENIPEEGWARRQRGKCISWRNQSCSNLPGSAP